MGDIGSRPRKNVRTLHRIRPIVSSEDTPSMEGLSCSRPWFDAQTPPRTKLDQTKR